MDIYSSRTENIDPLLIAQSQDSHLGWRTQQQPLQRFMSQPERAFFTAPAQQQVFPQNLNRYSEPTTTLPRVSGLRMVSPAPSQELSSTCSSARSPPAENEYYLDTYYPPQRQEDFCLPTATSNLSQGLPDSWLDRPQIQLFNNALPGFSCVNLSQVQGFADPQDVTFDTGDDNYTDMQIKAEYEVDNRLLKVPESYRHSSDEGIGASIRDEGFPPDSISNHQAANGLDADADADADEDYDPEGENEIILPAEPIESETDTEYTPKSTRSRKRRATKPFSPSTSPVNKRSRPTKPLTTSASKSSTTCLTCPKNPSFKNPAALQRHMNGTHTRPFVCVFAFAGCSSTFASKNEWKRHVATQHLCLSVWVCRMGACARGSSTAGSGTTGGIEFNRKDLFTQHLRRMHNPEKRTSKKNVDCVKWEETIKELQVECLVMKRESPRELGCMVSGCGAIFKGRGAWDERMEHVGRHLERDGGRAGEERVDGRLVEWAVRESVVERRRSGQYAFCGAGEEDSTHCRRTNMLDGRGFVVDEDEDADGEEE